MSFKKKLLAYFLTIVAVIALTVCSAFACTMIYVGSDNTADGSTFLARSEDYSNSYNKVAYVSPAGENPEGYVYEGCYGFTHTFSHDSYAYTANRDDNLVGAGNATGRCPNCGQTHKHSPMEEAGCNEKGVSVSAMVTLSWNGKYKNVDPMVSGGMCESDMTTVLLGEAASAKEGVDLLLNIYDTVGAEERSGVLIADQKEAWYIENYTGHQYIAIKLSSNMIAISPNMGAIGLVDLDDTENVIASKDIIAKAKAADSFVGDEAANQIDFRASYSNTSINARMINGLNYLLGEEKFTSDNITDAAFKISNVKDGQIVPLYTNIEVNRKLTAKDMVDFYKVDGIGNTGNLEWHIFQVKSEGPMETGTVEWLGMENGQYTVAIPYFPVLTTDMYEGYKVGGLGKTTFVTNAPENMYGTFPSVDRRGNAGFTVLPAGWDAGYYWSVDALSNYALSSACSAEQNAYIKSAVAAMQAKCYAKLDEMKAAVAGMSVDEAKAYCTAQSAALAKEAHEMTLEVYKHTIYDTHDFVANVVAPTCLEGGYTEYTCSCGASYVADYTEATGHSWSKGVCAECGEVAPAIASTKIVSVNTIEATGYVNLAWEAVEGASSYEIWRAKSADGDYTKMYTTKKTMYTNTLATPGNTYFYKVVAVAAADDASNSAPSEAVSGFCKCAMPVITEVGNSSKGYVTLKWNPVKGAKQYVIYRAGSVDGSLVKMYTTKNTKYTNTVATPGVTYFYVVVAECGNDAASAVSEIAIGTCKPTAPVIKAVSGKSQPSLKWDAVKGAQKYVIYRATADGKFVKMYTTTKTTYTNTTAKSGVKYTYKIVAVSFNPEVSSGYSNSVVIKAK